MYGEGASSSIIEAYQKLRLSLNWESCYLVKTVLHNEPNYISPITPELIEFYDGHDRTMYDLNPHKAIIMFPLQVQGEVIGVINFVNTKDYYDMADSTIYKIQRYVTPIAVVTVGVECPHPGPILMIICQPVAGREGGCC